MHTSSGEGRSEMTLQEALFQRLGLNVESLSRAEFNAGYYRLARRYHPDNNPSAHDLMANINSARRTILDSYKPG